MFIRRIGGSNALMDDVGQAFTEYSLLSPPIEGIRINIII